MKKIIVAIDGFSSCGKSTMARKLAREVGYVYVDTGAMYRAVALYCKRNGWLTPGTMDVAAIEANIGAVRLEFRLRADGSADMWLNGENVEQHIRTMEMSDGASRVSTLGVVRREMVRQQQLMGLGKGIVMDGRDIGTVVFPEAELKVFLTASAEVRAKRRMDELLAKGEAVEYDDVLAKVKERDERDQSRAESPLRKAEDAHVIDNTDLTPEEQQEVLRELFTSTVGG
ncbi:MAG: (d)CMP kinase [Bacteroidales bacterium]|jgi:cytidylate kinase|nr:(d)CMP kinase [Bacteroidales bacterium]ODT53021.1 MAG: cytidylate kinase [Paludibacter sp. SCN 50-10]OJX87819.1 MAG: cytidylate kinase [Paludibacter sp. 47-17]